MTETLYLIAHKVRGEAAFDIAIQMTVENYPDEVFWIIPTSGHRAYPYWHMELGMVGREAFALYTEENPFRGLPPMPSDLPDHYARDYVPRDDDTPSSLLAKLGLSRPAEPLRRRV